MTITESGPISSRTEAVRAARNTVTEEELARKSGWRALLHGGALLVALVPTTALVVAVGSWWAWLVHWLVGTVVFSTLPSVFHEATHSSLARNRAVNDTAGTLAAALHFVPFQTWRYFHLTHHANTGTEDDSEVYPARWSRWTLITFPLTQWVFLYLLWTWTASTAAGRGPRWIRNSRQRRAVRVNAACTLLVLAAIAVLVVLDPRIAGLVLVPSCLSLMVSSFTIVPEHYPAHGVGPGAPDQLDRTNSFQSNPVVRFLMWNSNLHAAHHFAPKVPAHHLPRVDEVISTIQEPDWRWSGYRSWYATRLRELPWRLDR